MTTTQTLPECFPHDPERAADERARWLAVYGATFAQLVVLGIQAKGRDLTLAEASVALGAAEDVANCEASARAAWEAEQVRKLDAEEGP